MIPRNKSERSYRAFMQDSPRWDHFAPRQGDIAICTQAKCGTTWMQRIVSLLVFQSPEPCPIMEISPWIDSAFSMPLDVMLAIVGAQTHRRFVKSHLPFDGLPSYDEVRYIHVGRDPRDACMSLFNHWSAMAPFAFDQLDAATPGELGPVPRTPDDLRSFWRRWFSQWVVAGRHAGWLIRTVLPSVGVENAVTGAARLARRIVLLVHYDDLKADRDGEMRRIAAFLGIRDSRRALAATSSRPRLASER